MEDRCETCGGSGHRQENKKLKITIPAGVDNGTRLRVSNEGDTGQKGGPAGDLYVYLFVTEDASFRRDGINVLSDLKITYLQAILGAKIEVETVDGPVKMDIPSGTQPGTVLTLENRGVPRLGNPVSRGDHLLTIQVQIPTRLNQGERELVEKLAEMRGDLVSKGGGIEGFLGGLFRG